MKRVALIVLALILVLLMTGVAIAETISLSLYGTNISSFVAMQRGVEKACKEQGYPKVRERKKQALVALDAFRVMMVDGASTQFIHNLCIEICGSVRNSINERMAETPGITGFMGLYRDIWTYEIRPASSDA